MATQTVFITGAARGIGLHLAEFFNEKSWNVVATDVTTVPLAGFTSPEKVVSLRLDVRDVTAWRTAFAEGTARFGRIDVCINNAGVIQPAFVKDLTIEEIDFQTDINLKGVLYGSKIATEHFLGSGGGHLINIASLAGIAPIHGLPVYAATKAAVRSFSLSIAYEMKQAGVFVSVLCPDLVATQMLTDQLPFSAANLTFSGSKALTVEDISQAVWVEALQKKKVEILVPKSRGWLGKIGNLFPSLGFFITEKLGEQGRKKREGFGKER